MRILLDTNVWRYLIDAGYQNQLYPISRKYNIEIVIAPIIIIETLRLSDASIRNRIIELQTRECWGRLMPESFLQCEDVRKEMIRTHPEWISNNRNINLYRKLRYDWLRKRGGFWEQVRIKTESIALQYRKKNEADLEEVRYQSRELRSEVINSGRTILGQKSLTDVTGSWENKMTGERYAADYWRVYSEVVWGNLLNREDSVFRQWLGCDINIDYILWVGATNFVKFWQFEAESQALPREWIRAAVYALQAERKVTDGNPIDAAISTHLVDVDAVVSADKNFITAVNRIHTEAIFKTARGFQVSAGKAGMDELFSLLAALTSFDTKGGASRILQAHPLS